MASIRKKKNSKFTPLSNGLLQDRSLSFATRGMLAYVLSKPEGWETRPLDIEREGNIGKDARRKIMKEAEIAGYLTFHVDRNPKGQIECWYDAHEEPVSEEERTKSWEMNKSQAQPDAENPQVDDDEPPAENPEAAEGKPPAGFPPAVKPPTGEPDSGQAASGKPVAHEEKKEVQKTDLENTEGETTDPLNNAPFNSPEIETVENQQTGNIDQIAKFLRQVHGISENAGFRVTDKFQSLAYDLDSADASLADVKAFWEFRTVKPQQHRFVGDFLSWRASQQSNSRGTANVATSRPVYENAWERSTRRLAERDYDAIAAAAGIQSPSASAD